MSEHKPYHRIAWVTSVFLIGTLLTALIGVPWYLYTHGLNAFLLGLFLFYFIATGLSITLGYHRLFSHLSFKASAPVRLFTLLFGAAAFENSALDWASDHRKHHKFVDHEEDPYNINRGFWHAHIGWLMFKLKAPAPAENVADLRADPLVMWQYRWCHWIGAFVGFVIPALLGWWRGGPELALGAFLLAGVGRLVFVQHMTFFINSLCHYVGRQPYSSRCTARDSALMAFFTFGEGYHNFHHEFQHDYRNGVKPWQFDPTKWSIWLLEKLGLVRDLRRVPAEKILLAETLEAHRRLMHGIDRLKGISGPRRLLEQSVQRLNELSDRLAEQGHQLQEAISTRIVLSSDLLRSYRSQVRKALLDLERACSEGSLPVAS